MQTAEKMDGLKNWIKSQTNCENYAIGPIIIYISSKRVLSVHL